MPNGNLSSPEQNPRSRLGKEESGERPEIRASRKDTDAAWSEAPDLPCPSCGYNLHGLPEHRCPECGQTFDPTDLTDSRLPWVHRRRIGRLRAYVKTVFFVMFRRDQFVQELRRPVSFADSQSFRWVTILVAQFPLIVMTLASHRPYADGPWLMIAFHASVFAMLAVVTAIPSYFFHPRDLPIARQNRAIALSYYSCVPLAWTPLLAGLGWIAYQPPHGFTAQARTISPFFTLACVVFQSFFWWWYVLLIARQGIHRTGGQLLLIAVAVPLLWIALGGLAFFGTNLLIRFPGYIYFSLVD